MVQSRPSEIVVVGAGIIGVTTALALLKDGHRVRLLDRRGVASETSRGNAGAFAFAEIEPLATPGIMRKAPKWLIDPLGPLSIRPAYAAQIAPWMFRFWRASRPDRYEAAVAAQSRLMKLSQAALERLLVTASANHLIRREGQMQVYETRREFEASLPSWELRRQNGVTFNLLEHPDAIADIQPGLNRRFTHAGYTPDWFNTVDPEIWTHHLARLFVQQGGIIETRSVQSVAAYADHVELAIDTGSIHAAQVVIACGAWSHKLAGHLGDRIPLETERGYNTTFAANSFDLRTHLTFAGHGFVVTRIGDGIRVGGAVELGGLELPPNYKRAETLVTKTCQFLDGFTPEGGKQWMGFRPSLPDSLPVVSRSTVSDRVVYAFGHGHLGLTQSAGTAELVAAMIANRSVDIPLDPYGAGRF